MRVRVLIEKLRQFEEQNPEVYIEYADEDDRREAVSNVTTVNTVLLGDDPFVVRIASYGSPIVIV